MIQSWIKYLKNDFICNLVMDAKNKIAWGLKRDAIWLKRRPLQPKELRNKIAWVRYIEVRYLIKPRPLQQKVFGVQDLSLLLSAC